MRGFTLSSVVSMPVAAAQKKQEKNERNTSVCRDLSVGPDDEDGMNQHKGGPTASLVVGSLSFPY